MTTKVALFCGGRGSATIIRELLRTPEVQLALLVNAYDDQEVVHTEPVTLQVTSSPHVTVPHASTGRATYSSV